MAGTPKVGYMPPVMGGFRCGNCVHYDKTKTGSGCNDKEVIAELGAGKNGLAAVDEGGCCNEFKPQPEAKDMMGSGSGVSSMLDIVRRRKKK